MKRTLELDRNKPRGQTILTSSDALYFNEFGPALFQSSVNANTNIHFNIIQPDTEAANLVLKMGARNSNNNVTFSFTYVDFLEEVNSKVYYCSDRFFLARDLLALDPGFSCITLDIDSLIMKPVPYQSCDLGLWLRPNEPSGMNLLAGMCYFSDWSIDFVQEATKRMDSSKFTNWFDDQKALWETYQKYDMEEITFTDFYNSKLLDWSFKDDTYIWTGKGPRKHADPIYVNKFNQFNGEFKNSA